VKLIKRTALFFRQGNSDKVYEVDLCEVGPDQYVVNARYGRRGSTLRENSKPVSLAKAEDVFESLVSSKTKKGYAPDPAATPASEPVKPQLNPAPSPLKPTM
jgi:predicted DNA-binding WGR domain protein